MVCPERKMTKKQYNKNKQNGICVRCGGRKAIPGKVMCAECAENCRKYKRDSLKWAKEHKFCPRCMKNKLMGEEKICPECLADAAIKNKKSREKNYGTNHNYYVMDIAKLKESGLCRGCRKSKVAEGHTYCTACLIKKRNRRRRDYQRETKNFIPRSERRSYNLCYNCGNPLDTDKGLCQKCSIAKAKNFKGIRGTNAYWKADNHMLGGVSHG